MKKLKRALSLILATVFIFSFCSVAFADNTSPTTTDNKTGTEVNLVSSVSINVKYGTTDTSSIVKAFEDNIKSQATTAGSTVSNIAWKVTPSDFKTSGTGNCTITYSDGNYENEIVNYSVVSPTGYVLADTISGIQSTDKNNGSNGALLSYVNSDLKLTGTGTDYLAAVGAEPNYTAPVFAWSQCNTAYNPLGETYTFTQSFKGSTLTRTLTVTQTVYSAPSIYIDYGCGTVSTNSAMKYSVDQSNWYNCSNTMTISSSWYGKAVYFYYPATSYNAASACTTIYMPTKANKPSVTPILKATLHTITITNCWDFDNCEFSIDGTYWVTTPKDTYTFTGLTAGTTYRVYVRTSANFGNYIASDASSQNIKTSDATQTAVKTTYSYKDNIGYADGVATVASYETATSLSGSLNTTDLNKFSNIVATYLTDYNTVYSTMTINQYVDDFSGNDLRYVNFSMPLSSIYQAATSANLIATYNCDLGSIELSNANLVYFENSSRYGSLNIEFDKVNSLYNSYSSWLYQQYNAGRPVYKLAVSNGTYYNTPVKYSIRYSLSNNETLSGLSVYYVDTSGTKTLVDSTYNTSTGSIEFTTSYNGYFVITYDGSGTGNTMNFVDVPKEHWAHDYISYCYDKGLFNGVSSNTFDTDSPVTRATIMTLMARLDGCKSIGSMTNTFSDVKTTDWFYTGASWAYNKALISGSSFRPNDKMTREDIAAFIYNFMKMKGYSVTTGTDLYYTDANKISNSDRPAVEYLYSIGIMKGNSDSTFNPKGNVTRAEMSTLMYRLYKYLNV